MAFPHFTKRHYFLLAELQH